MAFAEMVVISIGLNAQIAVHVFRLAYVWMNSNHVDHNNVLLKLNQDLEIYKVQNDFKQEHFDLYTKYLQSRHSDGPMSQSTQHDYEEFILGTWSETNLLEFRLDEKLISIGVFDVLPQGLSAVYTFYNTDFEKRGLGTLAILQLIQRTKKPKLPYLYLGYFGSKKVRK